MRPGFKQYITEAKNSAKIEAGDNTRIATAGEHLASAHILRMASEAHRKAGRHEHAQSLVGHGLQHQSKARALLNGVDDNVVTDVTHRAKKVAEAFLAHHGGQGRMAEHIMAVHHTPKEGDIERATGVKTDQKNDPSDFIVHFNRHAKDEYHGASYKNNDSNTLGTPGAKAIDQSLGTDHSGLAAKFHEKMKKKHGEAWTSKEGRKNLQKTHAEAQADAKKFAEDSAEHTHKTFTGSHVDRQRSHIKELFKMNPKVPYVLAKGKGTGGKYDASITSPDESDRAKVINNAKKFSTERRGSSVHYFAHDGDNVKHPLGYTEHRYTHSGFSSFGFPTHSAVVKKANIHQTHRGDD